MGPPSDASGATKPVACAATLETAAAGGWVCEHRDPAILRMVAFRRFVAGTGGNHGGGDGANAIAFSRGNRGFVAINRESAAIDATVATGLPAGTYCDLLTGGKTGAACAGTSIGIDAAGRVHLALAANTAVALTAAARL